MLAQLAGPCWGDFASHFFFIYFESVALYNKYSPSPSVTSHSRTALACRNVIPEAQKVQPLTNMAKRMPHSSATPAGVVVSSPTLSMSAC